MIRDGIAPLAATLVLVAITVIASLVTYVWVTSYTGPPTSTTEPVQLSEVLRIEGVGYTDGKLRVTIRNIGTGKATIAAVYILKAGSHSRLREHKSSR